MTGKDRVAMQAAVRDYGSCMYRKSVVDSRNGRSMYLLVRHADRHVLGLNSGADGAAL